MTFFDKEIVIDEVLFYGMYTFKYLNETAKIAFVITVTYEFILKIMNIILYTTKKIIIIEYEIINRY
jgi:hypothetical protein